ncbi:MAG: hypothetical protein GF308_09025 [Candidatus Heimdallarchaeota archaeon]|nr:hypothetical protein [Candidatus Heimdallarchaeota archaeon]
MLITKISLLDKSGMVLAYKPKVAHKEEAELLASGLMSAILTFSEKIQQQEIQSINYHDCTTSFIKYKELLLVIEIPNAIDKELRSQLLTRIKEQATDLLKDRKSSEISPGEAELILEKILNSINLVELGLNRPFINAEKGKLLLRHEGREPEILAHENCASYLQPLVKMINRGLRSDNFQKQNKGIGLFVPFLERNHSIYLFIQIHQKRSETGILKVSEEKSHILFRMTPVLNRQIRTLFENNQVITIIDALEIIRNKTVDTRNRDKVLQEEQFSLLFLEKNVKNIEKAIYSVVVGDPVIVIGDKVSTKICVNTLSIFGQHLYTEIVEWLSSGESEIGAHITGMSLKVYQELQAKGVLDERTTIVSLLEGKVLGEKDSDFCKKIFDRVKKKNIEEAYNIISSPLEELTTYAIKATEFPILTKERAILELKNLKKEINHNDKFDIVMALATKRNSLLTPLLEELQSTVFAAEDYLGTF